MDSRALTGIEEMTDRIRKIGDMAYQALLEEVYTSPKPGLVDPVSNGAHTDMNVHTFERSARALRPYYTQMAWIGYEYEGTAEELFRRIRRIGIEAERAMYQATDQVNTHKGLIFTLGIYCAAAGRLLQQKKVITLTNLRRMQIEMTEEILKRELEEMNTVLPKTNGERNFRQYGTGGVRAEALLGYPAVFELALPQMHKGIEQKRDWERIKLQTLLVLMANTEDSNILARHNPQVLFEVQQEIRHLLNLGGAYREDAVEILLEMDYNYTKRNISAGGCADLLAASIFLYNISESEE